MRRWNGWGDTSIDQPPPPGSIEFIAAKVGESTPARHVDFDTAVAAVPESRLADWPGLDTSAKTRLLHARGQSYPDWLAMGSGCLGPFPDAVASPRSHEEVADLIRQAVERGVEVIPYGGGTSVVGHLDVPAGERPVLSIDMGLMSRLLELDESTRLARFGAGVPGPALEAQLRAQGYVLGHYPQSFEYSTLGGWVVTRSSGQQSLRYGRIEQLFAGGRVIAPAGELTIPTLPASSAGPDLRELLLGSEGRMGIVTEAQVRVRPVPEQEAFHSLFFADWNSAVDAVREIAQAKLPLSMLRLSNARETETQLMLAGHSRMVNALEKYLRLRGQGPGKCMLLMGVTGTRRECTYARGAALAIARQHGGVHMGKQIGKGWLKNRFMGPYLRNVLWARGYGVDTAETAVDWNRVSATMQAMENAAESAFAQYYERVHAFTHLSHVYPQGSSIYTTFVFRATGDVEQDLTRWQSLKQAVSNAIVAHGGTISHQHGVGRDHKPYLPAEKGGDFGLNPLRAAFRCFDPDGLMNPGKLLD